MKDFERKNLLFSLCGLNCGLCPMQRDGHCPGCGGGDGNQSCKIARCSLQHDKIEYCFQCEDFPCERYDGIEEYDSFITHQNQKSDLKKAVEIGIEAYNREQIKKADILNHLLLNYNDGRRKTLYYVAVNLLDLYEIEAVMKRISENVELPSLTQKEQAAYVVGLLQDVARHRNIELKLHRKTNKKK